MFQRDGFKQPVTQFILTILMAIVISSFFMIISAPITKWFFGSTGSDLQKLLTSTNPKDLPLLQFYQVIQSISLFVLPPFILAYLFSGSVLDHLHINRSIDMRQALMIGFIVISAFPLINLLATFNAEINVPNWMAPVKSYMDAREGEAEKATEMFLSLTCLKGLLFNIFMVAILPAIGEELMFRGIIQKTFTQMFRSPHAGIIISAILFSAIHFQFSGFIPRMLLGMIFGYMVFWSGSIWTSILAHFINNAVGVIGYFYVSLGKIEKSTMDVGATKDVLYYTILSTAFFVFGCYYFHRLSTNQPNKLGQENV